MTSEIRTNSLKSRAGMSTVTMTDSGPMFSGITTFVDNSGFTFGVGGGTSIFTPATNVLTFGTNNTEKVRIDANGNANISGVTTAANFKTGVSNLHDVGLTLSGGQLDVGSNIKLGNAGVVTATSYRGDGSQLTGITGTTINNNANNRIITGSGTANTLNGESALLFNGYELNFNVSGSQIILRGAGVTKHELLAHSSNNDLTFVNNRDAGNVTSNIIFKGSGSGGGSVSEKMRITTYGVGINHDTSGASTNAALTIKNRVSSSATRFNLVNSGSSSVESTQIYSQNNDLVFVAGANDRLRITSGGQLNLGGSSTQTTHLLYLQSTGDAGIHIRADSDNSGENDNPYISMSQDGSNNQELKIGQNGDAGQNFPESLANSPFIHANHSSAYPLQLAHMDTMVVNIANRKNELALNDYGGNTIAGMEIHHRGNDTGVALKFTGHNNSGGTPGNETFTQFTHLGAHAKFMIHHVGGTAIQIGSTRRIDLPAVYGTAISSPMRDLYVESTGQLGYDPSIRASKINIADNNDVSWLYNLTPKTYNKRKRVSQDTNEWSNEAESDLQYGLIAEEVEPVNSNICFYDVDDSNNKTLAGVTYSQLITPILKAVQDLKSEINNLQQENNALRVRVTNLEGE